MAWARSAAGSDEHVLALVVWLRRSPPCTRQPARLSGTGTWSAGGLGWSWILQGRRLSYPRAEYLFKQASAPHDPHGAGWTLHQLRHSALRHLATLGHYVRLGEETSARITADNDPLARRRAR